MWCFDHPQKYMFELEMGEENYTTLVVDWCSFMREICTAYLERHPIELGGINEEDGTPIVVEIDESKYFHRKYHRGMWPDGHWVFGGIEQGTGQCFLVEVPNRRADTLRPIIHQTILPVPGTHIISDGWVAYAQIGDMDGDIYSHHVIIHDDHFVDPDDPEIHTNNVENMWMRTKRKLKRQFGTYRALFQSYLQEFQWRSLHRSRSVFGHFNVAVNMFYTL
ncbi:hypothetical protein ElyMa_004454400 [Elysia marginata]|uniref:ISXO2-like transposase domain-containing protein n=1 Tax=Elysia marginata TaxID=1093978 RepID=A0AAV4HEH9_9GAST|nr:hypothetical protein ElyMa_004454400 [Elysia marginata]